MLQTILAILWAVFATGSLTYLLWAVIDYFVQAQNYRDVRESPDCRPVDDEATMLRFTSDYDPAEDADSEISGYYPDQSAAPGSSRYGKTTPRRVEFVADYYLAVCNSPLPEG